MICMECHVEEAIIQMDSGESAKLAEIQTSGKQIIFNAKNYILEATQISKEEMFSKAIAHSPTVSFQQQQQQQQQQPQYIPHIQAIQQQQNLPLGGGQIMYHQLMQQVAISGSNQTYQMAVPMWYPNPTAPTSTTSPLAAAAIQQAQQAALLQQLQQQQFSSTALSPLTQQSAIYPPKDRQPNNSSRQRSTAGEFLSLISELFFKGIYEAIPDIQIVMGPDGKPAGEVRVTFGSRTEAERAIIECNQKMIGNRCIELHMA